MRELHVLFWETHAAIIKLLEQDNVERGYSLPAEKYTCKKNRQIM